MLERVDRVRGRPPAEDQFGFDQLAQTLCDLACWQRRCRSDQRVGKLAADCGARLRDLLDRRVAVEPRHQRILQRRGDRQERQRTDQRKTIVLLAQQTGFENRLGQFLDEQRHAVGAGYDLVRQPRRQWFPRDAADHRRTLLATEPAQHDERDVWSAEPWRGEFRPKGD